MFVLQIIVFNPTPVPATRKETPAPIRQAAEAFSGAAQPGQFQHRPHTALGGDLDNSAFAGKNAQAQTWEQNHHQQASNGLARAGEPHFAPADLAQALEAHETNPNSNLWALHGQEEPPHLLNHATAGRSGDPAAELEDNGRPEAKSGGKGRAAVEAMQVDSAPGPVEASQALGAEPPMKHAAQQWQGNLSGDAWPSEHFPAPPSAGTREAGLQSAKLPGQQGLWSERPAGDVLTETQEELSKQEPAVSTGVLNYLDISFHCCNSFP